LIACWFLMCKLVGDREFHDAHSGSILCVTWIIWCYSLGQVFHEFFTKTYPATAAVARVNDTRTLDLFAWLLVLARHDPSLEIELENRSTYLACAIHLVIVLQGRIEQWNSRSLANCLRESVESVHPVSFLSYLHKARRNFLVYPEGTLSRGIFPQQKGLVCRLSEGPSSSELIYFCPVIQWYPLGIKEKRGKISTGV
jgi:hypothetical protein